MWVVPAREPPLCALPEWWADGVPTPCPRAAQVAAPSVPQVTPVCNGACLAPTGCAVAPCRTRLGACGAGRLVAVQAPWTPARGGHARAATRADRLPRHRVAWTRSVCPIAAAHPSRRCAWGREPRPRQALGVRVREAAVDDHDRDALRLGLALVLRHREGLASRRCCRPRAHRQHPRRPGLVHILIPAIGGCRQHRHLLPP